MPQPFFERRHHARRPQVVIFATKTGDESDIVCSTCRVKIVIPAELLDVVDPDDFICPKCEEEEEKGGQ